MRTSITRSLTVLLTLASTAAADVIHVPAEQPTIVDAVAAALDGDFVLIAPGDYNELVVIDGKELTLSADGGVVRIRSVTVQGIASGKSVLLQDLRVGQFAQTPNDDPAAITLFDSAGAIRVEDCLALGDAGTSGTINPPSGATPGAPGMLVQGCLDVVIVRTQLEGGDGGTVTDGDVQVDATNGGQGARIQASRAALYDVEAIGGGGGDVLDTLSQPGGDGGPALQNLLSILHVSGSTLTGGRGGQASCESGGACGAGGLGGDAIHQFGAVAELSVRDNDYFPGLGGLGGSGAQAPAGMNLNIHGGTFVSYPDPYRALVTSSVVREGDPVQITVQGLVGDQVVVLVSLETGWLEKPPLEGLILVSPPLIVSVLGTLSTPELVLNTTVPELGPGVLHVIGRLQLAVTDGSGAHLGPARSVVFVDAAE